MRVVVAVVVVVVVVVVVGVLPRGTTFDGKVFHVKTGSGGSGGA